MPLTFNPFAVNNTDSPVWAYMLTKTKKIRYDGQPCVITVKYGIDVDFASQYSQTPRFSITGDIVTTRGREIAGGCIHDDIAKHFPELAHLVRWHLFGMHYGANAAFWMLVHLGLKEYKEQQEKALDYFKSTVVFGAWEFDEAWLEKFLAFKYRRSEESAKRTIQKYLRARNDAVVSAYRHDLYWAGVFVFAGTPEPEEPENLVEPFSKRMASP